MIRRRRAAHWRGGNDETLALSGCDFVHGNFCNGDATLGALGGRGVRWLLLFCNGLLVWSAEMKRLFIIAALLAATPAHAEGRPKGCPSLWCGCWLAKHFGLADKSLNSALAWLRFKRTNPHAGAVAVLSRGRRGGHVGIVIDANGNKVKLLSGNHNHRVGIGSYPKSRVIAYVAP
ncbi:MAG: CHAP domain-containing protein [Sphingobacteriales bacterium]